MLLEFDSLSDNVAPHSFFLEFPQLVNLSVFFSEVHLLADVVSAGTYSVHHFGLDQIIVGV
jgi:hypothetical protein